MFFKKYFIKFSNYCSKMLEFFLTKNSEIFSKQCILIYIIFYFYAESSEKQLKKFKCGKNLDIWHLKSK